MLPRLKIDVTALIAIISKNDSLDFERKKDFQLGFRLFVLPKT